MGLKGFVEGGIASIVAGCSTHPFDLIKVRTQLQCDANSVHSRAGPVSVGIHIVRREGVAALYSGISATVLRQALYSTTCMGLYDLLKRRYAEPETNRLPLDKKILAGLAAGGIGAAVGNPADVSMVRMQADGCLPPADRRNYHSVVDAVKQMTKDEGVGCLWRGSGLTVTRAMLVTAAQLASYDQVKETLIRDRVMEDGMGTHVAASFAAGIVAAVVSNPVDVIKTRVMNRKVGSEGAAECFVNTVKSEGVMALYKGFLPIISRQVPFTVVLFVTLEQVRKLLKDF